VRALRFVATLLGIIPGTICYVLAYTSAIIYSAAVEGWTEGRE
jgi:uncharacterized membrane protein YdjX (TVP38/TMEM64 family)